VHLRRDLESERHAPRDPRVALSVTDMADPYRMAAIQGRVVEVRPDEDCRYMDPISVKYTNAPFPSRGPDRVCFVIAVEKAAGRTLDFVHNPELICEAADQAPYGTAAHPSVPASTGYGSHGDGDG